MNSSTLIFYSSCRPPFKLNHPPPLKPSSFPTNQKWLFKFKLRNNKNTRKCRAVISDDAPFAAAIGACMLTSLVFPVPPQNDDADSPTDTRFAVMGILSFVPYFNWLSWVFAWMDTGHRRYVIYSLVYLVPYLRTNLSLSPEESWLPIASILFCIVHIQLEASIRNGDIQGFQLFRNVTDKLSSSTRKKSNLNQHQDMPEEGSKRENKNLPPSQEQSRDIGDWGDSQRPLRQRLNEDLDDDDDDDDDGGGGGGGEERGKH